MKWSANDIISATDGKCKNTDWHIDNFCLDSRLVKKGDIFIALKTEKADGHDFIQSAIDNGAVAVIVEKYLNIKTPQVIVNNTLNALTDIGKYARAKLSGTVIAITGSVGKTSTKDMLKNALSMYSKTYASIGNLNNHLGVPLSLAHTPIDAKYIIVEMGMSAPMEIDALTKIAKPDIAVVLSVENNHLEFFDSTKQIGLAKAEIFNGLNKNAIAIYNDSTNHTDILKKIASQKCNNIITYGNNDINKVKINNETQSVNVNIADNNVDMLINGLGSHRILNSLAVLNIIFALKLDLLPAIRAIKDTVPSIGRGLCQSIKMPFGQISLFDESYNASPASMKSALEVLGLTKTTGRRVAILGDMLEFGKDSIKLHMELLEAITQNKIDVVFACGEYMKYLFDICPKKIKGDWKNNSSMLAQQVVKSLKENDTVMVKGSLGSKMKLIIDKLKVQD